MCDQPSAQLKERDVITCRLVRAPSRRRELR